MEAPNFVGIMVAAAILGALSALIAGGIVYLLVS